MRSFGRATLEELSGTLKEVLKGFQLSIHTFRGDTVAQAAIKNYLRGFCSHFFRIAKAALNRRELYKPAFVGEVASVLAGCEAVARDFALPDLTWLDGISGHLEIWLAEGQESL